MADVRLKNGDGTEITCTGVEIVQLRGTGEDRVSFQLPPTLQEKSVTISENGSTDVAPDDGYDGLSKVTVEVDVGDRSYYLLRNPTGTMPTYENGYVQYLNSDNVMGSSFKPNIYVCGCLNASESYGVVDTALFQYGFQSSSSGWIGSLLIWYAEEAETITETVMKTFAPTWTSGDVTLVEGWNITAFTENGDIVTAVTKKTTLEAIDAQLFSYGGIPANNFDDWSAIDTYTLSFFKMANSANLQEKTVTITKNGDVEVAPDDGYDGLSKISIEVSVPESKHNAFVKSWKLGAEKITNYDMAAYFDPTVKDYYSTAGLGGTRALHVVYDNVDVLLPLTEVTAETKTDTYTATFMQQAEGATDYQNYAKVLLYLNSPYGTATLQSVVLNGVDVTASAAAGDTYLLAYVNDAVLTTINGIALVMPAYDDPDGAQWVWENSAIEWYASPQFTENRSYFEARTVTLRLENRNSRPAQLSFTWSTTWEPDTTRPGVTQVGDVIAESGTFNGTLEAGHSISVLLTSPPTGTYVISTVFPSTHVVISDIVVTVKPEWEQPVLDSGTLSITQVYGVSQNGSILEVE